MPKTPRQTDDPLGQKLLQVLRETGHEDDLNELARQLDVKVQSTYDYIKHGRLSKDRYPLLVRWSKRSLDWWFDVPQGVAERSNAVNDAGATYKAWPVAGMSIEEIYDALGPEQRAEVSGFIKGMLAATASSGSRNAA